ncbi:MAG: hypothetical protein Q9195_000519 [Heterodermia aff. obscurata]
MPSATLVTPSLETFLESIEVVKSTYSDSADYSIQYLVSLLKRRQIRNSRSCAIATAHLLSLVVSKHQVTDIARLIHRVQEVGQQLTDAQPKELAVGNIVRRVLGVIRDEAEEDRGGEESLHNEAEGEIPLTAKESEGSSLEQQVQSTPFSTSRPLRHGATKDISTSHGSVQNIKDDTSAQYRVLTLSAPSFAAGTNQPLLKSMFNLLSHPVSSSSSPMVTPGTQTPEGEPSESINALAGDSAARDLRAEVVEAIEEIIEELNTADDQIAGYALDHVHSNEIILTHTASVTVQKFLLKAAAKRKFTVIHAESYPNDHESVHATVTGSLKGNSSGAGPDRFHKSLTTAGITVILIPDSAVFALMSRVNKVILGTHAVLANGSLVAAVGSRSIAKAASMHKTPVVVLSAVYKLSPIYPFSNDALIEYGDTSKMFSNDDADLIERVEVDNPLYDYVPSELIDLYITNLPRVNHALDAANIYSLTVLHQLASRTTRNCVPAGCVPPVQIHITGQGQSRKPGLQREDLLVRSMDFLKSAVAAVGSVKGPPFPYTFGDQVTLDQSIWKIFNGVKREDKSDCSIFTFDAVENKSRLPLARNAVRKLRTLRHPGVVKVLDTVEVLFLYETKDLEPVLTRSQTDSYIYIATERLVPLQWPVRRKALSEETLKWGLFTIAV